MGRFPPKNLLAKWCSTHIGTVHTFQGKESETVIFILGADQNNHGAMNWASSKPNLLNVALTRAKDRIYVIGDYQLWSRKKYFSALSQVLPVVNAEMDNPASIVT
jgi:superfamily I DNA and/or RNA helicase